MGENFQPGGSFLCFVLKKFLLKLFTKYTCKEILGRPSYRKTAPLVCEYWLCKGRVA
jgi:hypothetical protein